MRMTTLAISGCLMLLATIVAALPPASAPGSPPDAIPGWASSGDFKVYDAVGIPTHHEVTLKSQFDADHHPATLVQRAALAVPVHIFDPSATPDGVSNGPSSGAQAAADELKEVPPPVADAAGEVAPAAPLPDANLAGVDGAAPSPTDRPAPPTADCSLLTWYRIEDAPAEPPRYVEVRNRFGTQRLTIRQPRFLLAPSAECGSGGGGGGGGLASGAPLDHYKAYEVLDCRPIDDVVGLLDANCCEKQIPVLKPKYVAVPVEKRHGDTLTEITDPDRYLTFYEIQSYLDPQVKVPVEDQFGQCAICIRKPVLVGTPTHLSVIDTDTDLDNFQVYDSTDAALEEEVRLEGPFDNFPRKALAHLMTSVATPVDVDGLGVINAGAHFTWYAINDSATDPVRTVTIWNRFGEQRLNLGRAVFMLVPAGAHGGAASSELDHYKAYVVLNAASFLPDAVTLRDEFGVQAQTAVRGPALFCVPVSKTHGEADATPVHRARDHLTFYAIRGAAIDDTSLGVQDQFGNYDAELRERIMLGVPTLRLDVFPPLPASRTRPAMEENMAAKPRARGLSTVVGLFQSLFEKRR